MFYQDTGKELTFLLGVVAGTYRTEAMEEWIQPGQWGAEELPRPIQCPVSGVYPQRVCSMRLGGTSDGVCLRRKRLYAKI